MVRTTQHIDNLMKIAISKSNKSFSDGSYTPNQLTSTADKFIKNGLTKSQIKAKLRTYSEYALNIIAESDNAQWSELAKLELSNIK